MHGDSLKHASSKIFSGLAKSYEKVVDYVTLTQDRRWKDWVAQRIRESGGGVVLDVGCGTLLLEERFAGPRCRFVGLDLSPEMIRLGQGKKVPNVALLAHGDAEFLPFTDRSFDAAVSCYVPKYVDVERFGEELARVTRPGAAVVLYDFVKPRGILAPIVELYIQGGLRILAMAMRLAGMGEAYAFSNLPWIIAGTAWDAKIVNAMESRGFETLAAARLTGGAIFAYWGRKGGHPLDIGA